MGNCHHFLLLLLLTFFSSTQFLHKQIPFVNGDTDLIQKTCKTTKYYDLCVSSLKSDSASPNADTKGLAVIMVRIGIANATSTNSYLSSQLSSAKNTSTNNVLMKKVLKECADEYSYAREALKSSLEDLANEVYDHAYVNVMVAANYPNACHNAFKRYPKLVYPTEVAIREDGFKHICDVVLGIIDALGL